ncbi:hypothetical protein [Nocardia sp. CA-119907]
MPAFEPAAATSAAEYLAQRRIVVPPNPHAWRPWHICGGLADESRAGR